MEMKAMSAGKAARKEGLQAEESRRSVTQPRERQIPSNSSKARVLARDTQMEVAEQRSQPPRDVCLWYGKVNSSYAIVCPYIEPKDTILPVALKPSVAC